MNGLTLKSGVWRSSSESVAQELLNSKAVKIAMLRSLDRRGNKRAVSHQPIFSINKYLYFAVLS